MTTKEKSGYAPSSGSKQYIQFGWTRYQDQTDYHYYFLFEASAPITYSIPAHSGKSWSSSSISTPGYKLARKTGTLPVNPYSKSMFEWTGFQGTSTYVIGSDSNYTTYKSVESGCFGAAYGYEMSVYAPLSDDARTLSLVSDLEARTATSVRLKAKDLKTNLPQVYAERSQTIEMIAGIAKKIGEMANIIIHRQYSEIGKVLGLIGGSKKKVIGSYAQAVGSSPALKTAANGWLSIQMGWKPLLQDIFGALEELANSHEDPPPPRRITSTNHGGYTVQSVSNPQPGVIITTSTIVAVTAKAGCVVSSVGGEIGSRLRRLGITNPASVTWEIIPFSFVIDWFYPIGNFLESLDASYFQQAGKGYTSLKIETWTIVSISAATFNATDGSTVLQEFVGSNKLTTFTRSPMTGLPEISLPVFKNPLSASHIFSALSLVIQRIPPLKAPPSIPKKPKRPPYDWGKDHRS